MKTILRWSTRLGVGFVVVFSFGFAALAQTPSGSAAGRTDWLLSSYTRLTGRSFDRRPRGGCFCDEDCLEAELRKPKSQWRFSLQPSAFPSLKMQPLPQPVGEIRVIDLEGLKKVLQRDPGDKRPLLLNFWATWCDPCREEFPDLVKLDADYKDKGLNFIAVSLDDITDIKSEVPKFLNQMKATMPVVLLNVNDPEPAIKLVDATWDGQLPATFLYDKDGKIVFKHFGKIKPDELRTAIDAQLKK